MKTLIIEEGIKGVKAKVLLGTAREAAMIVYSTPNPEEKAVEEYEKSGSGHLIIKHKEKDPDNRGRLLWINSKSKNPIAELGWIVSYFLDSIWANQFTKDGNKETWPAEIEAYYKSRLFREILEFYKDDLQIPSLKPYLEIPDLFSARKIKVFCSDTISPEMCISYSRECLGGFKTQKDVYGKAKEYCIWVNNGERSTNILILESLYHETIHLAQQKLKELGIDIIENARSKFIRKYFGDILEMCTKED